MTFQLNKTYWLYRGLGIILGLSCITPAIASDIGAQVHGGTLGVGAGISYPFTDKINGRLGFNTASLGVDVDDASDIDYDADIEWQTVYFLADYHPFGGTFRVTGGLMSNGNELTGKAKLSASQTIGDTTYTIDEVGTLKAKIDFDSIAPYLGVGWGRMASRDSGFSFNFDIGFLFQGSPNVSLRQSGGIITIDPADIKAEENEAEDDIDEFDLYPVISFGAAFYF